MMLKPVTLAVIDPNVMAARAVVDKCPTKRTDALTRLYSSRCVLGAAVRAKSYGEKFANLTRRQAMQTWPECVIRTSIERK